MRLRSVSLPSGHLRLRSTGARRLLPFPLRLRIARVRSLAVRHRLVRRLVGGVVVLAIGLQLMVSMRDARTAREQWGSTVEVLVAAESVAIGTAIDEVKLVVVERPAALVPADALTAAPAGDSVVTSLMEGEVVTVRALASTRAHERSLPEGHRAVGFPIDAATPRLQAGDQVDLIVVEDPFSPDGAAHRALRPPAIVLSVDEDTATLAVDSAIVSDVVSARSSGRVSMAVR